MSPRYPAAPAAQEPAKSVDAELEEVCALPETPETNAKIDALLGHKERLADVAGLRAKHNRIRLRDVSPYGIDSQHSWLIDNLNAAGKGPMGGQASENTAVGASADLVEGSVTDRWARSPPAPTSPPSRWKGAAAGSTWSAVRSSPLPSPPGSNNRSGPAPARTSS